MCNCEGKRVANQRRELFSVIWGATVRDFLRFVWREYLSVGVAVVRFEKGAHLIEHRDACGGGSDLHCAVETVGDVEGEPASRLTLWRRRWTGGGSGTGRCWVAVLYPLVSFRLGRAAGPLRQIRSFASHC